MFRLSLPFIEHVIVSIYYFINFISFGPWPTTLGPAAGPASFRNLAPPLPFHNHASSACSLLISSCGQVHVSHPYNTIDHTSAPTIHDKTSYHDIWCVRS